MSKNKLLGEDEVSYHVYDGKKNFLVAKKGISKALHEKIRALPSFGEGGEVPKYNEGGTVKKIGEYAGEGAKTLVKNAGHGINELLNASGRLGDAILDPLKELGSGFISGASTGDPGQRVPAVSPVKSLVDPAQAATQEGAIKAQQNSVSAVPSAPTASAAPKSSGPNFYNQLQKDIGEQKSAIMEGGKLQSDMLEEQAKLQEQMQKSKKQMADEEMADLNIKAAKVTEENEALKKAGMNNEIDPGRLWSKKSTGNKVLGIIGLILGGIGGGLTGRGSDALAILNKQIDADISAQEKDKENKQNLFKQNVARLGDIDGAKKLLKMQMLSATQGQIEGLALKYGSEKAKNDALQLAQSIDVMKAELGQKLYNEQATKRLDSIDPLAARINSLPPALQDNAYKELEQLNRLQSGIEEVDRTIDGFADIGIIDRANPFNPDLIDQKASALVGVIKPMLGEAMQEADVKRMIAPFIPGWINNTENFRETSKKELKAQIMSRVKSATPILSQRGWAPPIKDTIQIEKNIGAKKR